ncbi:multidrug MFS transporter [Kineothrix sp. MSJ-39]|uniref:glycosyltransferase n=1 Tax=Kineothrix sp. MSJ-39 TaxID=2841533 RepID=UPI001C0FB427|nr:glycosyltransferase [Kineothrix sp. MSJ-39]MBU5428791.1 multidrug MFS transporter [Kineothrix sp. MSJ-39]
MIFVTVGTHEQQFNRLVEKIDELKGKGVIKEDVIMQTGFCTYKPVNCQWDSIISYSKMNKLISDARIVITHGGPSSFLAPLQIKKIPIVVPRQKMYNEHVNNHQLEFCKEVARRLNNIIVVEEIDKIEETLTNYDEIIEKMPRDVLINNNSFCTKFENIVGKLFNE